MTAVDTTSKKTEQQARADFAAYFLDLRESMKRDGGTVNKAAEWKTVIGFWIEEGQVPAEAINWKCPRTLTA
jgi:hypothetical protein